MTKTIPKEKKCKNAKWLSEKALQKAVKRRDMKSKGEKESPKEERVVKPVISLSGKLG